MFVISRGLCCIICLLSFGHTARAFRRPRLLRWGSTSRTKAVHTDEYIDAKGNRVVLAETSSGEKQELFPVIWSAKVRSSVRVKEETRTTEQYLALPASQYSVLTAKQVERLNDSEFKVTLGNLNFFGNIIIPILYVSVNVFPDVPKSEIIVTRAETVGSEAAESVNGTFSIVATNIVTTESDKRERKLLCSDTSLQIDAMVPKNRVPIGLVRRTGNFIIQSSLSVICAAFVRILAADFKRWSAGSDERDEVEGASLDVQ